MDPFAILGIAPGADERELLDAYRELAKQWHPDRGGGEEAAHRMAEINAAYDVLRAARQEQRGDPRGRTTAATRVPGTGGAGGAGGAGGGTLLSEPIRRALGPELVDVLAPEEAVPLVTPASTWASPRAVLAVTDRRLLWLLDDAPVARVRSLGFRDVAAVEHQLRRPRRRVATLTVRSLGGRRFAFTDLLPHTAAAIERHVRARSPRLATT